MNATNTLHLNIPRGIIHLKCHVLGTFEAAVYINCLSLSCSNHAFVRGYSFLCHVVQVLREKLGVKTVLGLTATATKATCTSIVTHLSIPDGEQGVIKEVPLPNNLILSVSRDEFRDRALVSLLQGKRFKSCQSIIVYCTRREECERLARLIRTCLQV
jgi:ATP-dependent DNA helicase Q4